MKKLLKIIKKEVLLTSRSYYFYIELFVALLILAVLLFIPDNFTATQTEYLHLDLEPQDQQRYLDKLTNANDTTIDNETISVEKSEKEVSVISSPNKKTYLLDNRDDLKVLAKKDQHLGISIHNLNENELTYEYFLQGYESKRYQNLIKILNSGSNTHLQSTIDQQKIITLNSPTNTLTDKEHILPVVLVLNGGLMGMFMVSAYIFLDKQEDVIRSFSITPTPLSYYLLSKTVVVMGTSLFTMLIIIGPIMKFEVNYGLLIPFYLASSFLFTTVGLVIASFYDSIIQAFGTIYGFLIVILVPVIQYLIPSWNAQFIKLIPSYSILNTFQAILTNTSTKASIFYKSTFYLGAGIILFIIINKRYKTATKRKG